MKTSYNLARYSLSLALPLCVLAACEVLAEEGIMPRRGIPTWEPGDWWIISSDILIMDPNNPIKPPALIPAGMPATRSVFSLSMIFRVSAPAKVDAHLCDVLQIFPHRLPKDVVDDTQGEPLWQLFIRQEDGSLAKCKWKVRSGPCFVSGQVEQEGERAYRARRLPVVNVVLECVSLDVPFLDGSIGQLAPLRDEAKMRTFQDEWTNESRHQTTEVYEDILFGKLQRFVRVSLSGDERQSRTQLWAPGYPWWIQWTTHREDGMLDYGILRSRLIEFGKKGQEPSADQDVTQADSLPKPKDAGAPREAAAGQRGDTRDSRHLGK